MSRSVLYRVLRLKQDIYSLFVTVRDAFYYRLLYRANNPYVLTFHPSAKDQQQRQVLLHQTHSVPTVCFVFRGIHWIDFFLPIHHQLQSIYGDSYQILYISDLQKTVKRNITAGLEFYRLVRQRLVLQGIDPSCYFDCSELGEGDVVADMLLFSENMNHLSFGTSHRVYLPHYFVLKAKDRHTWSSIRTLDCNHFFIPSRGDYFYTEEQMRDHKPNVQLHQIGYPRFAFYEEHPRQFVHKQPMILYAPSLEKDALFSQLDQGILEVFSALQGIEVVIKLHPSLAGYNSGIGNIFAQYQSRYTNIHLDTMTPVHHFIQDSSLLITDFGSVGAEYKLLSGKPVLYLPVPEKYIGGSDLEFRDKWGDTTVPVSALDAAIHQYIGTAHSAVQLASIRASTVFNYATADQVAAQRIHRILRGERI